MTSAARNLKGSAGWNPAGVLLGKTAPSVSVIARQFPREEQTKTNYFEPIDRPGKPHMAGMSGRPGLSRMTASTRPFGANWTLPQRSGFASNEVWVEASQNSRRALACGAELWQEAMSCSVGAKALANICSFEADKGSLNFTTARPSLTLMM